MRSAYEQKIGTTIDDGQLLILSILGRGAFGVVFLASERRSCLQYAVKCLDMRDIRPSSKRELAMHQRACSHPGVLTLYKGFDEGGFRYLVLEYCPEGDLFDMVTRTDRYTGNVELIKDIFIQILDAVEHCHSVGVYHRDLKLENVLCYKGGKRVLLADFGLATDIKISRERGCGSEQYMSPDCRGELFRRVYSYSTVYNDVWALGIMLANIVSGRGLWADPTTSDPLFDEYCRRPDECLREWLFLSRPTNDLLRRVLHINWRERPSIAEFREAVKAIDKFTLTLEEYDAELDAERAVRVEAKSKCGDRQAAVFRQPRPQAYTQLSSFKVPPASPVQTPFLLGLGVRNVSLWCNVDSASSISSAPSLSSSEDSNSDPSAPVTPEMAAVAHMENIAYLENITDLSLSPCSSVSSLHLGSPRSRSPMKGSARLPIYSTGGSGAASRVARTIKISTHSSMSSRAPRIFFSPEVSRKSRRASFPNDTAPRMHAPKNADVIGEACVRNVPIEEGKGAPSTFSGIRSLRPGMGSIVEMVPHSV